MSGETSFDRESDPLPPGRSAEDDEAEAAARRLVEKDPSAFLNLLGLSIDGPVRVIEAGVFPHVLPIDRVYCVAASEPRVAVVALAVSPAPDLVASVEVAFATLNVVLDVPIEPIVVLA